MWREPFIGEIWRKEWADERTIFSYLTKEIWNFPKKLSMVCFRTENDKNCSSKQSLIWFIEPFVSNYYYLIWRFWVKIQNSKAILKFSSKMQIYAYIEFNENSIVTSKYSLNLKYCGWTIEPFQCFFLKNLLFSKFPLIFSPIP